MITFNFNNSITEILSIAMKAVNAATLNNMKVIVKIGNFDHIVKPYDAIEETVNRINLLNIRQQIVELQAS